MTPTFKCQIAIGKTFLTDDGKLGFTVSQGIQCEDAIEPNNMFDKLITYYNSLDAASALVSRGDMLRISYALSKCQYKKNRYNEKAQATFTCVEDSDTYALMLSHTPCVFVFCANLQRWVFFSYRQDIGSDLFSIMPLDVESLLNSKPAPHRRALAHQRDGITNQVIQLPALA